MERLIQELDPNHTLLFGPLDIDVPTHLAKGPNGKVKHLTKMEFALIIALDIGPDTVWKNSEEIAKIVESLVYGTNRARISTEDIGVHIMNLRAKLGDDSHQPTIILNQRGVGYKLAERTKLS